MTLILHDQRCIWVYDENCIVRHVHELALTENLRISDERMMLEIICRHLRT